MQDNDTLDAGVNETTDAADVPQPEVNGDTVLPPLDTDASDTVSGAAPDTVVTDEMAVTSELETTYERVKRIVGEDRFEEAIEALKAQKALNEEVIDWMDEDGVTDSLLAILTAQPEPGDSEAAHAELVKSNEMLVSDNKRLTRERDEARAAAGKMQSKLADIGTVHGSVDGLRPVV
jgi:hypothetical protein